MPLVIPNTTINNAQYDTDQTGAGGHTFLSQLDLTSGWVLCANQPIFCRLWVYTGSGLRPLPEFLIPPSITPFNVDPGGQPIRRIDFRQGGTGSTNAQVFGVLFSATEPGSNPNGINYGISAAGGFVPPVSTLQFQLGGVTIGSEGTLDFENTGNVVFALVDDPAAFRMKVSASVTIPVGTIKVAENVLAAPAASVTLPGAGTIATAIAAAGGSAANYHNLRLQWQTATSAAIVNGQMQMRFNGDAGANYDTEADKVSGAAWTNDASAAAAVFIGLSGLPGASAGANSVAAGEVAIPNFDGTTLHKIAAAHGWLTTGTAVANLFATVGGGRWRNTAAVTSVTLLPSSGNFITGSRFTLWAE